MPTTNLNGSRVLSHLRLWHMLPILHMFQTQLSEASGTQHQGVFISEGSGGILNDLVAYGGRKSPLNTLSDYVSIDNRRLRFQLGQSTVHNVKSDYL